VLGGKNLLYRQVDGSVQRDGSVCLHHGGSVRGDGSVCLQHEQVRPTVKA
jgi:hypothetical protein